MEELTTLFNEVDASGGAGDKTALRDLQAKVHALWRHYELAEGIISAYLGSGDSMGANYAGARSEIDAAATAWLNTVVKG